MFTECEINDLPDGISVNIRHALWPLLAIAAWCILLLGLLYFFAKPPDDPSMRWYAPAVFFGFVMICVIGYPKTTKCRFTPTEIWVERTFMIWPPSTRSISTKDVSYLGFLPPRGKAPGGIFVEFGDEPKGTLIIKRIGREQATTILRRVRQKLFDRAQYWRRESSTYGTTTLYLD